MGGEPGLGQADGNEGFGLRHDGFRHDGFRWCRSIPIFMSLALMIMVFLEPGAVTRFTRGEVHSNNRIGHRGLGALPANLRLRAGDNIVRALVEEPTDGDTAGRSFSMTKGRKYTGPGLVDGGGVPPSERFLPPDAESTCERWAVVLVTSTAEPSDSIKQLAEMQDWCVLVVAGDKGGPVDYELENVTYLSPSGQEAMPYRIASLLPWNHLGRKSIGYLYAIHHGAKVIYDVQDGVHLINPDQGLPYTDTGFVPPSSTSYTRSASTFAHNPYPCFGAMDKVWPRGFPLNGVTDPESNRCDSVSDESIEKQADGSPRPLGVVQSLVNIEPDVDAMCRLNDLSGHLSFDFAEAPQPLDGAGESPLKIVPPSAFTPYNAQATLHFSPAFWGMLLPVTVNERVSDIWRSYFTQAFLSSTGAVAAFAYPWAEKFDRPLYTVADLEAEQSIHQRSGALVEFLAEHRQRDEKAHLASSVVLSDRISALVVAMYEYGIVEEEDVALTHAWLQDLSAVGYTPGKYDAGGIGAAPGRGSNHPVHEDERSKQNPAGARVSRASGSDGNMTAHEGSRPEGHFHVAADDGSDALRPPAAGAGGEGGFEGQPLLVIAIPSARPDRRQAIRESWLAWADDRVVIRFFTDLPAEDVEGAEEIATALRAEVAEFGDVIIMDLDRGMNFTRRLLWAMEWMSKHYDYDFFIKLDDDYFLCLARLLDELELMREKVNEEAPYLYGGKGYCLPGKSRIDEAYLLMSSKLVRRVVDIEELPCGGHAGKAAGWWFTPGNVANKEGDVRWVDDPRLDHNGIWWYKPKTALQHASVCNRRMGVHHTYVEDMAVMWSAAKDNPGPRLQSIESAFQYPKYRCELEREGISNKFFYSENIQNCRSFKPPPEEIGTLHCGAEGC